MGKLSALRNSGGGAAAGGAAAGAGASAGGIMNTGIFGMFGTVVQCKSDDTSMFCTLSKIVNGLMMILFLFFMLYIIYMLFNYFLSSRKSGGLGPRTTGGYIVGSKTRSFVRYGKR